MEVDEGAQSIERIGAGGGLRCPLREQRLEVRDLQRGQQLRLAREIAIQRTRLQPDPLGELAHRHGLEAMGGDQRDRGGADRFFGA